MVKYVYLTEGRGRQWERIWAEGRQEMNGLWNKGPEEMGENGIQVHVEKQTLERSGVSSLSFLEFWERRERKIQCKFEIVRRNCKETICWLRVLELASGFKRWKRLRAALWEGERTCLNKRKHEGQEWGSTNAGQHGPGLISPSTSQ